MFRIVLWIVFPVLALPFYDGAAMAADSDITSGYQ